MQAIPRSISIHRELWLAGLLIALGNIPLLSGGPLKALVFIPGRVAAGEWWRVFTGFFVHVSLYHLLLDAGAFLMLLHSLKEFPFLKRASIVTACAAGSLLVSLPVLGADGTLCGLSGVAHGLLAVVALNMAGEREPFLRRAGLGCFVAVVLKSLYEAASGSVLFASLHLGDVAAPVAVCHAGGILGGVLLYAARRGSCGQHL
jgi:rhomboid family GlyGly-CTERM serine protease